MEKKDYTAAEVGYMLGVSASFVYKERERGNFPASQKYGDGEKGWRWTLKDIEDYRERHRVEMNVMELYVPKPRYKGVKKITNDKLQIANY